MDGTILDTIEYHWLAWKESLGREGVDLTYEQFLSTFGMRNDTILRKLFGSDLSDAEVERIAEVKETHYRHLVRTRGVTLLPGVAECMERLREQHFCQAIASSAPRANVEANLTALGITRYIDTIVCADDVRRGKPDPQVFLLAAERVRVAPERCIVIEDAPAGLEGARRAGMHRIGVCTSHDELSADYVVRSLADLPDSAFSNLVTARHDSPTASQAHIQRGAT
jgi:beta-phosphoglucomutase